MTTAAFIIGLVIMLIGFVGVFVPLMPGIFLIVVGAFVYSWMTGFDILTWPWLLVIIGLGVLSVLADFLVSALVARRMGASNRATAGTVIGTAVGVILYGAWGALFGGVGGAVLGELSLGNRLSSALKSGMGAFVGFLAAMVADVILACVMIIIFLVQAL